jgi:hypothetical protein
MWLRHALSVAILPFTVTVLVPLWIARGMRRHPPWDANLLPCSSSSPASALLGLGLTFFIWSPRRFAVEGKGTLAPGTRRARLVVRGPYATSAIR